MSKPKTLTDAAIARLAAACAAAREEGSCDASCDVCGARMGWCGAIWEKLEEGKAGRR